MAIPRVSSPTKPLIRGSALVLIGSLGGGFLNYLFHLTMGRLLSPTEYGILITLFSLLYIISVPGMVLGTTAAKFASRYKARGDFAAVTAALVWTSKVVSFLGLALVCLSFLFKTQIAGFLKIPNPLLVSLFFVFTVVLLLGSAPGGFLCGLLRFKAFAFISPLNPFLKILLGGSFAALGFGVWGVTWGLIISSILTVIISFLILRKDLRFPFEESSFVRADLLKYALPTTVVLLALTSFYNADVILVKHFFSPEEAGIYGAAVIMGRIIFFSLGAVVTVMFPLASEKHENGADPFGILKGSLLLVSGGALLGTFVYFLFPHFVIGLLLGPAYFSAAPYLGLFALFMGLYAVVDLISRFFLSVCEFRPAALLLLFSSLQAVALCLFHTTLLQVICVNIGTMIVVLASLGFCHLRTRDT